MDAHAAQHIVWEAHFAVCRFIVLNVPPIAGLPLFMPPFTPEDMSSAAQVSLCMCFGLHQHV